MGIRRAAKGIGEFLTETIGEAVAELVLGLLACALLSGIVLTAYLSWSFSPRATVAGVALLSLFLARGAWQTFREPVRHRRRGWAAVAAAGFTLAAATAVFLLLYATDCACL
ncbi:lysine transporter LysE [Streptomyces sp. NPDC056844]|uniref:lysine transporter LysE n=1 Tax=unclassified Streptomyces TaxID=2593676 RepID=UPI003695FCC0